LINGTGKQKNMFRKGFVSAHSMSKMVSQRRRVFLDKGKGRVFVFAVSGDHLKSRESRPSHERYHAPAGGLVQFAEQGSGHSGRRGYSCASTSPALQIMTAREGNGAESNHAHRTSESADGFLDLTAGCTVLGDQMQSVTHRQNSGVV